MGLLLLCLTLAAVASATKASSGVLGCGGFVRFASRDWQEAAAAASRPVQVVLRRGDAPGDRSDVGPDGYWFIPVDVAEEGRLTVEAPAGWSFRPAEARVRCGDAEGADVEFVFGGVGVTGRVACAGCSGERGAGGVSVMLEGHAAVLSDASGRFAIESVQPGEHELTMRRHSWSGRAQVKANPIC
jgi:hypothetical protein